MSNVLKPPISKRELLTYQADVKGSIFRQIREKLARLKEGGFTQKELGIKIGMDAGLLSRRLRGDYDLHLETLSDLARGLDCRMDVRLAPLFEAVQVNREVKPITEANDNSPARNLNPSPATRNPQDVGGPRIVVSAN